MKKLIATLLVLTMVLSLLAACGKKDGGAADADQEGSVSAAWDADKDNHWHLNDKGEQVDLEAHDQDGEGCSVCGAVIDDFGNGEIWVTIYNEQGDTILSVTYLGGEIVENDRREYTYDEEGRWSTVKKYKFGTLVEDTVFQVITGEDYWECIPQQITTYNEDGTRLVEQFDETSWAVAEELYDADGKAVYKYKVVNEFNGDGFIASVKKMDGKKVASEVTYEYDDKENSVADRYYENEKLVREEFYTSITVDDFSYSFVSKVVAYNEDGTQTVTEYDEYGEVIG